MRRLRRLPRASRLNISKLRLWRNGGLFLQSFFCEIFSEKARKNKSVNAGLLNKETNGDILHLEEVI